MDADSAKANPPPTTDSILRSALDALAGPASPVSDPALVASAAPRRTHVPVAPATGDGRTVTLPATVQAIASGGDTLLGRILTRAVLADPQPSAPADATPVDAAANRIANAAPAPAAAAHLAGDSSSTDARTLRTQACSTRSCTRSPAPWRATTRRRVPNPRRSRRRPRSRRLRRPAAPDPAAVRDRDRARQRTRGAAPPAPAVAQPQHVDANAVVDQMLRGMAIRTTDGQSEVRLRLVPENLGDVSVKLVVSGGSVDASIVAHTADAQTALAGGQIQLAKTLADAGLKLQSFTVGLAGDFAGNRDQSHPNGSWNRPAWRRIGGVESVDADEPADTSLLAVPSFGPPIYAASPALRHLNYLV